MFGATRFPSAASNTSVGIDRPTKPNVDSVLSAVRHCSGSPRLKAISSQRSRWVYSMARRDCISPNTHLSETGATTTRSPTGYHRATTTDCWGPRSQKPTGLVMLEGAGGGGHAANPGPPPSSCRTPIRPSHAAIAEALSSKSLAGWSNERLPSITYVHPASELARERKVDLPHGEEKVSDGRASNGGVACRHRVVCDSNRI